MNPTVYLAGPITGLTFDGCDAWRTSVAQALEEAGIKAFSPLRGKDYLRKFGELSGHGREYYNANVLSTPRAVITRDRFDATRCDVMLVNLLGAKTVSIGTVMEMAFADTKRIPIVCAIEDEGNPHDHMFVNEVIGFRVTTLDEAIRITEAILVG